jgi:hypothetical protein
MTVQTSEHTTVAAPTCHGHGSAAGDATEGQALRVGRHHEAGTGATALGAVLALPRPVRIIGGAAIGIGALLTVGVPLATLTPFVALGGCLSMHLFMGHGEHGGHSGHGGHGGHGAGGSPGANEAMNAGPTEVTSPRKDV